MAAKWGEGAGLGGSGLQEHSGDGGNKVHWGLPVQDPSQGGPSGQSVVSTTTTFALQSPAVQPTNTVSQSFREIITKTLLCHQVTLFTRGKAPITQQLPGESDAEYAEFSSKVCVLLFPPLFCFACVYRGSIHYPVSGFFRGN
jgi:hypothetical protein